MAREPDIDSNGAADFLRGLAQGRNAPSKLIGGQGTSAAEFGRGHLGAAPGSQSRGRSFGSSGLSTGAVLVV